MTFVDRLKKGNKRMYAALNAITPVLRGDEKIEVNFQNNAQLEEYQNRLKPQLLSELKEKFNNDYLELVEQVMDAEKLNKPKLLSNSETLENMIEKNPALQILRNKFNLDFE